MKSTNIVPETTKLTNLGDFDAKFPNEQACRDFFEQIRWNGHISCPNCGSQETSKFKSGKLYWCKDCKKQFTVRVGTIFEDSALPLRKWFLAIYLLTSRKKGISSVQLSKDIGVTQKTAWFMLHRIRYAVRTRTFEKLSGTVEIDETWIGGKRHGMGQGHATQGKTILLGMKQRGGDVRAETLKSWKRRSFEGPIAENIAPGSEIFTDDAHSYGALPKVYKHESVNHSKKEYVRGRVHTNGIESFWALFKRVYHGTYHWMSPKHLDKYVDECEFRMNSKKETDAQRFASMLEFAGGRMTYKQLILK